MDITSQRFLKLSDCLEVKTIKKMEKFIWHDNHKGIIISLTTNFIAAFHRLYLLVAHVHSPQLILFSFWVENVYVEKPKNNVKQEVLT